MARQSSPGSIAKATVCLSARVFLLSGAQLSGGARAGLLLRHPWMTLKVTTLIRLHGIGLFLRRQRVPQEAR